VFDHDSLSWSDDFLAGGTGVNTVQVEPGFTALETKT